MSRPNQAIDKAYLDNEDLDEELGIGSICQRGGGARDADTDSTEEIAEADRQSAPEQRESWCVVSRSSFEKSI